MNIKNKIKEALLKKSHGDISGSESIFLEIIDILPLQYEALINLGLINVHKKLYEKSINYFKEAKKVDKKNIDPYINLGNIYILQKNYTNAIKFFEIAHEIDRTNLNVINNLSFLYNQIDSPILGCWGNCKRVQHCQNIFQDICGNNGVYKFYSNCAKLIL